MIFLTLKERVQSLRRSPQAKAPVTRFMEGEAYASKGKTA